MIVQAEALLRAAARRGPWAALGTTAAGAAVATWWRARQVDAPSDVLVQLRLSAVLIAAAAATCLEDGAELLTATTPFGRPRRRALAVAITAPAASALWVVILAVTVVLVGPAPAGQASGWPVGGLLVELGALCGTGWLLGASMIRWSGWRGSAPRAAIALLVLVVLSVLQPRLSDWLWAAGPGGAEWGDAHLRWAFVGAVALAGFAVLSRDPAARLRKRRFALVEQRLTTRRRQWHEQARSTARPRSSQARHQVSAWRSQPSWLPKAPGSSSPTSMAREPCAPPTRLPLQAEARPRW